MANPNGYVSTAALRSNTKTKLPGYTFTKPTDWAPQNNTLANSVVAAQNKGQVTPTTKTAQTIQSTTAPVTASQTAKTSTAAASAAAPASTITADSAPVASTVKSTSKAAKETDWAEEYQRYLEEAREEAIAAKAAAIQAQVEALEANKTTVNQNADNSKTDVYTNSRTSAIGNNDILAAMGLAGNLYDNARSGYSESSRINQDVGLRNNLNSVETERANALNEIANQIAQAQATGESDIAGIKSDYANQLAQLQMQIEQQQYDREQAAQQWLQGLQEYKDNLALQEAALTGNYNGQQTMNMQQYLSNLALSEAGLTGSYNGTPTMDWYNLQNTLANGQTSRAATQASMALEAQEAARKAAQASANGTSDYSYAALANTIKNSRDPAGAFNTIASQNNLSSSDYQSLASMVDTAEASQYEAAVNIAVKQAQQYSEGAKQWVIDNPKGLEEDFLQDVKIRLGIK